MSKKEDSDSILELFNDTSETIIFLHSTNPKILAWLVQGVQRLIGKDNVSFQRPWKNLKTGKWTLKMVVDVPETLLRHNFKEPDKR
jgi:hypothetical protein